MINKITFFLYYAGLVKLSRFINRNKVKILMYHRVDDKKIDILPYYANLNVSIKNFEEQMRYLSKNYNVIPLNDIININKNKKIKNSVIITFDDGYIDNYLYAYPILKKYNLPATIFLPTDFIENKKRYWLNKLYYLINKFNLLTNNKYKEQLKIQDRILLLEKLQDILKFDVKDREIIISNLLKKFNLKKKKKYFLFWKQINKMRDLIPFVFNT